MAKYSDKSRLFSRRAVVFGGLQAAGLTALAGRLYYLQFLRSDEFKMLSENNRIKLQLLTPERGKLLDSTGEAFASNEKNYLLYLDATGMKRSAVRQLIEKVGGIIQLPEKRVERALDELKANPYASPLLIKEHLTWEEVAAVELHQLELPGLYIDIGQIRYYPFAEHSSHLIGYVGAVSQEELDDGGKLPLLRQPDYKIGKSGVEQLFEMRLRGQPGLKQVEVNVHGQPVRELGTRESVPGENMQLTIDSRLQEYGYRLLEGESAAAVVMDVTNGNVLAMLSVPGFDPNVFSKGIPAEYWKELQENKLDPLVNKAVQGQYPPGSTFKMITGLAGLREGAISPSTRVFCPGHFFLGNHRFNCWKEEGHGSVDLVGAIAQSCDTYFYTVGRNAGIEAIRDTCRMLGLGDAHLLGLLGEKPGLVPDPVWKQKRYKQKWTTGDTVNASIGQGYVLATPLQLGVVAARLATGLAVTPRLHDDGPVNFAPLEGIPPDHLEHIQRGMYAVANEGGGTAAGKRITEAKYAMAGKTGTSQVRRIEVRGQKQESIPWEHRHHALFIGYAPVEKPRFACAVIVEHGGGGSAAAAPRARDLLWKIQLLADGIEDDPPTVPVKPLPMF